MMIIKHDNLLNYDISKGGTFIMQPQKEIEQIRAKSVGRSNIRARYISQNQKLQSSQGTNGNSSNLNTNLINSQLLISQLQSTKNNEDDIMNMKKSSSYRIKQNLNSSSAGKNLIEVPIKQNQLQQHQIYQQQQSSTKNTNMNSTTELDQTNHSASGVFNKKQRIYSSNNNGGVNSPFRNKINSQIKGSALIDARQKNPSSQSYHLNSNAVSTNNINASDIDDANHTASGIFHKKTRNNSSGVGNLPYRQKMNQSGGNQFDNRQQRNSPIQGYTSTNNNTNNNNLILNQSYSQINTQGIQGIINGSIYKNQPNSNIINSGNLIGMNMDNIIDNNISNLVEQHHHMNSKMNETQIRQSRINNLKSYLSNHQNNLLNSEDNSKPSSMTKSPNNNNSNPNNNNVNNTQNTQNTRNSSQKNVTQNKNNYHHQTHYGYFQNSSQQSQDNKIQPLKALHNFTDSDIHLSTSQKNTQDISSGRQQQQQSQSNQQQQQQLHGGEKDSSCQSSSTTTQNQNQISSSYSSKNNESSVEGQQQYQNQHQQKGSDYLQNINNSINNLKNNIIGQTFSTNTSSLLSQQITEKEANIEEMHYYAVEFQQNCKKWLSHIEDTKILL